MQKKNNENYFEEECNRKPTFKNIHGVSFLKDIEKNKAPF